MKNPITLMTGSNIGELVALGIFALVGFGVWYFIRRINRTHEKSIKDNLDKAAAQPITVQEILKADDLLGKGKYKAYALKNGDMFPTTIKEPIGDLFNFDSSMPVSGYAYWVKVVEQDAPTDLAKPLQVLELYNPIKEPFAKKQTPEYAYFATHWDIVKRLFASHDKWWESAPMWMTVGIVVLTFILTLVLL